MKSTQAMRDRCRELSNTERDDYDRAVVCVIDDLEGLLPELDKWLQRASAAEAVLEFIVAGYANQDVNHKDFRVHVYKAALDALNPVTPADRPDVS